ncbi:RagB/SusD family nutrient uptake outer membrane protein [Sinomicrobium sp. M5D2P9]
MNIKLYNQSYKKLMWVSLVALCCAIPSCSDDFLDVVPDNVSTIEHAFKLRNEAEKYLFTCYSYLPRDGDVHYNIGMLAGDEIWIPYQKRITSHAFEIARGNQRRSDPYMNAWQGNYHGGGPDDLYGLYKAIRHCNIFLENVRNTDNVPDLRDDERKRWLGEVEFLKAYYHFYLLRMYGPIPIIDENLPIDAAEEEVNVKRQPVDECVDYIAALLDSAAEKLPESITDRNLELGRITKPIALGIKAKLLLMAASPLFNGNPDFSGFTDNDGTPLFNPGVDETKWQRAADAALEAIRSAEGAGHSLYKFPGSSFSLSDTTMTQMSIRQAICERWNPEHIWANSNSLTGSLQLFSMAPLHVEHNHNNATKILSPPLKMARLFYTHNGVPVNEDKTLDFTEEKNLRVATHDERFYIEEGFETARLNFDREPRFYASLCFDGGTWYKYDSPSNSDEGTWVLRAKYTDYGGSSHAFNFNETGYYIKKLVDWNQSTSESGVSYKTYAWPQLRLAEVYLMYAEALNETSGPSPAVYEYLDKIRERAGLEGIVESWENYSVNPSKYASKEGLREIIHHERLIELAFEGHRFWDLRRWKKAVETLNAPITGWNIKGEDSNSYYQVRTIYQQQFIAPRDYFWPIGENAIIQNPNLVQNPGW